MIKTIQLLFILSLVFLAVSCKPNTSKTVQTDFQMSSPQITRFMEITNKVVNMSHCGLLSDKAYMLPTLEWVQKDFAAAFDGFKFQLNAAWKAEENDCDDFARFAAFFAQYLHHNTPSKRKGTALAFGEFWYTDEKIGLHAINIFLYRNNQEVKLGFFEPQSGTIVKLTDSEFLSCELYKF